MNKRHEPSGWILGWIDKDNKVHTKSIPITTQWRPEENAQEDAKSALILLQLDLQQQEFESGKTLPPPTIAKGLTRKEVKMALLEDRPKLFDSPMIMIA